MTSYANFDTSITFPAAGTTYRKVLMIFTLGKYVCPAGSEYCGSWDYLVNNYIMTPGGDTMEIARLITPYATTSTYFPNTWTYNYVFDVTDYVSLLHDNATVRIGYAGYSYGFSANIRFAFIEGTPDRNVIGLERLWHGSFEYGVSTDPITNHVFPIAGTTPSGTVTTDMKMRITGHGEDGNNCNEFCPNTYDVILNGSNIATQNFFRTTCGENPIYTQTGTWVYDRANWCPGALVYDIYNPLPAATGAYSVNVTFPAYTQAPTTGGNPTPTYDIEAASVYYGAVNKTLDASLEEILAPNDDLAYSRSNAVCGSPIVHVHNSGSTAITSLSINYGITGGAVNNYNWTGSLASLQDTDVSLPAISDLITNAGTSITQQFTANIVQVNGAADDDATNNTLTSSFKQAPLWQSTTNKYVIKMKTSAVNTYSEGWQILDVDNNVVASLSGTSQRTLYTDTITLPAYSCYKLVVTTPDGYGLLYGNYGTGVASDNGSFAINKYGSVAINIPNYHGGDFGTGFTQYFSSSPWPAGVSTQTVGSESLDVYPNPAQNTINVDVLGIQQIAGQIEVIDALGRVISQMPCNNAHQQINTAALVNGIYTIVFINDGTGNKLQSRMIIAK